MHTSSRTAILLVLPILVMLGADAKASDPVTLVGTSVRVHDATSDEIAMVRWGVDRYRNAGLTLPAIDIYFHDDHSGCRGWPGYFIGGRIDLCPGLLLNLIPRDDMLHEMAHAWSQAALTDAERQTFMRLRGVETWNATDQPWALRGFEQAAEIVAWGIGDGVLSPAIPNIDEAALVAAYELLTHSAPPA